jgi:hypothetical protein
MNRGLFIVSMAATAVGVGFVGIQSVFSYYTFVAADRPRCAELTSAENYRIGISDLAAFPLFSLVAVWMIVRIGTGRRSSEILSKFDLPVARIALLEATYGMFLLGGILLVALLILGLTSFTCAQRYYAVAKYCVVSPASPPGTYLVPQR